ncbi:MAG: hypothetical protein ABW252_04895 [Polyangiales bacterium]
MSWSFLRRPTSPRKAARARARRVVAGCALALALTPALPAGCAAADSDDDAASDALREATFDPRALFCVRRPRTLVAVTPPRIGPVAAGTVVTYDVRVKNNDSRACGTSDFTIATEVNAIEQGLSWVDWTSGGIAPGATGTLRVSVRGDESLEAGTYGLPFRVVKLGNQADLPGAPGRAELVVGGAAKACEVRARSELLIRDLTVVEDPRRTRLGGPSTDPSRGVWTFTRLIENAARTPADAPALVEAFFRSFAEEQTINDFVVPARSETERFLLTPWRKGADDKLDLTRVPLRLLAIVNRLDVRNLAEGHAGEASFVFGMFNPQDFTLGAPTRRAREVDFTVVLEYRLPARTPGDVLAWARAWHQLGSLPFPSEAYNAALEALTRRITARGALPGAVHDSALLRVRTNDGKLEGLRDWQLREFALSPETGLLAPRPTRRTPDTDATQTERLGRWVEANAAAILREEHEVPATFEGMPFQAGASRNDNRVWDAAEISDLEVRHRFALQTCNGCHGEETLTDRKHISSRLEGELSFLSGFLVGETITDPITGEERSFGELSRRRKDLEELVCGSEPAVAAARRPTILPVPATSAPAADPSSLDAGVPPTDADAGTTRDDPAATPTSADASMPEQTPAATSGEPELGA